ncbi:hypothetical protein [Phenylobacterium sp.]|uniref:hypothetical protein n=1 Tax=Phenylobacterium sp. TaxID=1871053 RepID=UPI0027259A42|nr:hypothetical protein [Phenylobacterium sp.]MDO8802621.1 hypothetical protein [Phenylobacterium sp.]
MRLRMMMAATAAGLALAGSADAQVVTSATNICEIAPGGGGVYTVKLNLFSFADVGLEYTFRKQPSGPATMFPAAPLNSTGTVRKFQLPEGTYKLTFKHPNSAPIGTYAQNIVVRPYRVVGQTCVLISPRDKIEKVGPKFN